MIFFRERQDLSSVINNENTAFILQVMSRSFTCHTGLHRWSEETKAFDQDMNVEAFRREA